MDPSVNPQMVGTDYQVAPGQINLNIPMDMSNMNPNPGPSFNAIPMDYTTVQGHNNNGEMPHPQNDQAPPPSGLMQQDDKKPSDRDRKSSSSSSRSSSSRDKEREKERSSSKRSHSREREKRRRSRSRSKERERGKRSRSPTSPPPRRRRRNKSTLWDVAPTGFEVGQLQIQPLPQSTIVKTGRQTRRLYIGNIPIGVTDREIAEFFNTAMLTAKVTKDNNPSPVIAVQMNREKKYAFLEFTAAEDATAGMGFDGIVLKGHALKVRRPNKEKANEENLSNTALLPNIVSTNVGDSPHKVFIGGIPSYLNEEQVKELVSSFGQLRSFHLVRDNNTGNSKGYAFFEYYDPEVTDRACAGLNGMSFGEKTLVVQRASLGIKQPGLLTQGGTSQNESILNNPTASNFLNLGIPIAAACALLKIDYSEPGSPSRVVVWANFISSSFVG